MFHLLHWGLPEGVHFPVGNPLGTWNIFSRASSTCKGTYTYTYTFNWCSTSTNYDSNKAEQGNCQKHLTLIYQRKSASINTRLNTGYGSMNINNYSLKFWGMVIHKSQVFQSISCELHGIFQVFDLSLCCEPRLSSWRTWCWWPLPSRARPRDKARPVGRQMRRRRSKGWAWLGSGFPNVTHIDLYIYIPQISTVTHNSVILYATIIWLWVIIVHPLVNVYITMENHHFL